MKTLIAIALPLFLFCSAGSAEMGFALRYLAFDEKVSIVDSLSLKAPLERQGEPMWHSIKDTLHDSTRSFRNLLKEIKKTLKGFLARFMVPHTKYAIIMHK